MLVYHVALMLGNLQGIYWTLSAFTLAYILILCYFQTDLPVLPLLDCRPLLMLFILIAKAISFPNDSNTAFLNTTYLRVSVQSSQPNISLMSHPNLHALRHDLGSTLMASTALNFSCIVH